MNMRSESQMDLDTTVTGQYQEIFKIIKTEKRTRIKNKMNPNVKKYY